MVRFKLMDAVMDLPRAAFGGGVMDFGDLVGL